MDYQNGYMVIWQYVYGDIMPKRITISDEEYFKILELKVKYKTDSLFDVLSLVTNNQNVIIDKLADSDKTVTNQITNMAIKPNSPQPEQPQQPEITEQPINPSDIILKEWIKSERSPDIKNNKSQK